MARSQLSPVKILSDHFEAAGKAWRAYRQPTPQDWFKLLDKDLSALPQLRQSMLELLEELPMASAGLGATEMRMLELIRQVPQARSTSFPGNQKRNQRRVFDTGKSETCWTGSLIVRRPPCPVSMRGRSRWRCTRIAIVTRNTNKATETHRLGRAVLAGTEDFSRHNPIYRGGGGGAELTNDRLWWWGPANDRLIAPS